MTKVLSTSEFAKAIGVSESTVRRMADRGDLATLRTQGGHRKIPLSEAIRYSQDNQTTLAEPSILGLSPKSSDSNLQKQTERCWSALHDGDEDAFLNVLSELRETGLSTAEICDGPIRSALNRIGNQWPTDKRSIFIEHRATVICSRGLNYLRYESRKSQKRRDKAAMAIGGAPADDPFCIPSMMVAMVFHDAGWRDVNLGTETPVDVLIDAVEEHRPEVVWLALTNPIRSRVRHREIELLADTLEAYDAALLVGGQNASTFTGKCERFESLAALEKRIR